MVTKELIQQRAVFLSTLCRDLEQESWVRGFFSSWPHASRSGRSLLRYRSPSYCHRQKSQAPGL